MNIAHPPDLPVEKPAKQSQRSNQLRTTKEWVEGLLRRLPAGPLRENLEEQWPGLYNRLELLTTDMGSKAWRNLTDLYPRTEALIADLEGVLALPLETALRGPQVESFFVLFEAIENKQMKLRSSPVTKAEAQGDAHARTQRSLDNLAEGMLEGKDWNYIEFRTGRSATFRTRNVTITLSTPNGAEAASVGRLRGIGNGSQSMSSVDRSGMETNDRPQDVVLDGAEQIATYNFETLQRYILDNNLTEGLRVQLGRQRVFGGRSELRANALINPLGFGRSLRDSIARDRSSTPEANDRVETSRAADLAELNRALIQAVGELQARRGGAAVPDNLVQVTAHAGEQVRSTSVRIDDLLSDRTISRRLASCSSCQSTPS